MRLVWGTSGDDLGHIIGHFVLSRTPNATTRGVGDFAAVGVTGEDNRLIAGVLFHNYQPEYSGIEVSTASDTPRWLTKNLIAGIMAYPFTQLQCRRVTAATPRKAASVRRFLETFGFKREGLIREGFGTDDMVVYGLLRSEWDQSRWAQPSHKGKLSEKRGHASPGS